MLFKCFYPIQILLWAQKLSTPVSKLAARRILCVLMCYVFVFVLFVCLLCLFALFVCLFVFCLFVCLFGFSLFCFCFVFCFFVDILASLADFKKLYTALEGGKKKKKNS